MPRKNHAAPQAAASPPGSHPRAFIEDVLSYFYPAHYRLGMEMESAMSLGRVDRKQAALLWLVHSRLKTSEWVTRKDIETSLNQWFEISNSKISRLLGELSDPPLSLLEVTDTPQSAREKRLRLTPAGRDFVDGMIAATVDILQTSLGHLSREQLEWGLQFFSLAFGGSSPGSLPPFPPSRIG